MGMSTTEYRIAEACKGVRLTIQDLSGLTGIDVSSLSSGLVTVQQLDQIAHATGADPVWLSGWGCPAEVNYLVRRVGDKYYVIRDSDVRELEKHARYAPAYATRSQAENAARHLNRGAY